MIPHGPDAHLLRRVLDGAEPAARVREVVAHPQRYGGRELFEAEGVVPPSERSAPLRSKYKPGHKLSADYLLWSADHPTEQRHATLVWTVTPAGTTTALFVSPADERMPQLARLTDPRHVASLVAALIGRSVEPRQSIPLRMRTVRYRPGQRHVLVTEPGWDIGRVFIKTDRDCSGADSVPMAGVLKEAFARRYPAALAVEPIGWAPEDSAALWWAAPGRSLSRLVTERPGGLSSVTANVGRALRAVHDVDASQAAPRSPHGRTGTPLRDATAEARAVLNTAVHIPTLLPDVGLVFAALLSEVLERLDRMPSEPLSLAHGDFKCDNILIDAGAPRILDLDRVCSAEPALDLGKFLADLAWWAPDSSHRRPLEDAFRDGYGPCDPLRWDRARLWAVLFLLKNVARRTPVHAPDWESLVVHRVHAADRALSGIREHV